jgi:hypothetical protein
MPLAVAGRSTGPLRRWVGSHIEVDHATAIMSREPGTHTGPRSGYSERRKNRPRRSAGDGFPERSASSETAVCRCGPCTWRRYFRRYRCRASPSGKAVELLPFRLESLPLVQRFLRSNHYRSDWIELGQTPSFVATAPSVKLNPRLPPFENQIPVGRRKLKWQQYRNS